MDKTNDTIMELKRIPRTFNCGGQQWWVSHVDRLDDNLLGRCSGGECLIEIANEFNNKDLQSDDCKVNTFYHELVHAILDNIGQDELSGDHKFVCSFAALLTESMRDARFIVNDDKE